MRIKREQIRVDGLVQGVGFRPFVYRLAQDCKLRGFVNNTSAGALIEIEGSLQQLDAFRQRLTREAPPLANIVNVEHLEISPGCDSAFSIQISKKENRSKTFISPDVTVCDDCLSELFDPGDRRHGYPFINCTNCGPRYTIIKSIPYDRAFTSMNAFQMCEKCSAEYHDPESRRFHAQPNACAECGPQLRLRDSAGRPMETADPITAAISCLKAGKIVALRGIGGFHLAVDAANDAATLRLRQRKGRGQKPFALMAPDLKTIKKLCRVNACEGKALVSLERPIVLLAARSNNTLAPSIAPNNSNLGVMLPYTPLHYLLLKNHFDALVMTSGNFSEEPIAIANDEAMQRLAEIADYFLLHDREILQRCDDSIVRHMDGKTRTIRRSRGYAPKPFWLNKPTDKNILACGGEQKNTIALSRGRAVFLSQHIGDLNNPAALGFFEHSVDHLQHILEIKPQAIAFDLHPEYHATKWALQQKGLPLIGVQHHHAHLAAVMAENNAWQPTIGIILDGTGYGTDGAIWGGEVLVGDARAFQRFAWLEPVALPGGETAIRQPWRIALSCLYQIYGQSLFKLNLPFLQETPRDQLNLIIQMIEKKLNAPLTTSCGRLFDGIAALLNIRKEISYEAQAAIELEMCIAEGVREHYENAISDSEKAGALPVSGIIKALVEDLQRGRPTGEIVALFHNTLVELFLGAAIQAREKTGVKQVGLSGGVFQNRYFFERLCHRLRQNQFKILTHQNAPTNDGGLALGQIVIANAKLQS